MISDVVEQVKHPYLVESNKTAKVPQFPSNVNKAELHWRDYLLSKKQEGYKLVAVFPQVVGVETLNMFVFELEQTEEITKPKEVSKASKVAPEVKATK